MERQVDPKALETNSSEYLLSSSVLWDLSPLKDRKNLDQTLAYFESARTRFESENWRGGIAEDRSYSIDDVENLARDINSGNISPYFLTANQLLAFAQASKFRGAEVPERLIARLYERAQRERNTLQKTENKKPAKTSPERKWIWGTAASAAAIGGIALVSRPWEIFQHPDVPNPGIQPSSLNVIPYTPGNSESNSPRVPAISLSPTPTETPSSHQKNLEFSPEAEDYPLVEEVESDDSIPYHLWDIDFSDPKTGIVIKWSSPEVLARNNKEPLIVELHPVPQKEGEKFGNQCKPETGLDCSRVSGNFITVGAHTTYDFTLEAFRAFLAAPTEEERAERIRILESERPTVTYGDITVLPQVAIVRLSPSQTDILYHKDDNADGINNEGWDAIEELMLEADPTLRQQVNLDKRHVIVGGCDRWQEGEVRSGSDQPEYQVKAVTFTLAEAAVPSS